MRIALVSTDISSLSTGMSSFVTALAANLCSAGEQVTLLTSDIAYRGAYPSAAAEIDSRVDTRLFRSRSPLNRRLYRAVGLRKWLARNVSTFDVVHIQGLWSFVAVDAANICAHRSVPYIITPHGQTAREDWQKRSVVKTVFFRTFCTTVWKRAAAIHFLSQGERDNSVVQAYSRGIVIPSAVAPPPGADNPSLGRQFRRKFDIPEGVPIILFLGRLVPQKGVGEILDAFRLIRERAYYVVLVIAGSGDEGYAQTITQKVRTSAREDDIRLTGPLYGEDKGGAFASASAFITLSTNEGLPIAPLEAISSGVPVVLSEETNIPEVARYGAGLIVRRSAIEAANALERILRDRQLATQMELNGLRLARDLFSWQTILPKMGRLYQMARSTDEPARY